MVLYVYQEQGRLFKWRRLEARLPTSRCEKTDVEKRYAETGNGFVYG